MVLALELIKKYVIPQVLIHIYKPTLDSDGGVGRDVSSERGSTRVQSSLRC